MWPDHECQPDDPIRTTSLVVQSGAPVSCPGSLNLVTSHAYSYVPTKSSSHAGGLAGTNQVSAGEPPRGKIQNTCSFLKAETAGQISG